MSLEPFTCEISEDRREATMRRGAWMLVVPVGDLTKWLALYRTNMRRRPASRKFYEPCEVAIAEAMRGLGMSTADSAEKGGKR